MEGLPPSVAQRLQALTYNGRAVAYLKVDARLALVDAGGHLDNYGLAALRLGEPAVEQALFLEGLLPLLETPYLVQSVELAGGRAADLHFHLDDDTVWVVLLDVTADRDAARRIQQKAYEMTLLKEKEELLNRRLEAVNLALLATQRELEIRNQFIEQTFGRYMSSEIADTLLKSPTGLDFGGQKKTVTIMISDLRGFAAFSETLPPEAIVKLLNNYLSEMTTVIQKYNGTIDSFVGDAILTIFGAPVGWPDDADRAVACALEMQMAMPRVNAWNAQHGFPELEMGVGINTGEVVAGNIGSRKRAKYSVMGSNVNLAGRIEGYTTGGQILISGATRDAVKARLAVLGTMTAEPKGMAHPITIYEIGGIECDHRLALPRRDVQWIDVEPALALTFQRVTGKEVVKEKQDGVLVRLSANEAEIQSQLLPPPLTDLKLLLKPADGARTITGIYGKVIGPMAASGSFILRFTAIPQESRQYFECLRSHRRLET
jgi:adenylate cyclase